MRVGLDAQLALGTATGIGEYIAGLVPALRAAGIDAVELADPNFDPWRFDRRVAWDQFLLPRAARRAQVELLHCTSGTMPLVRGLPVVVTVHDLAWLRVQQHARFYARMYFGDFQTARYRGARRVVTDSHFTRDELLGYTRVDPSRVDVVYLGVSADVVAVVRAPREQPFVLAVGTVERRKNLAILVRALASLPAVRLVSVGPFTPYRDECLALAHELGVAERFELRGYVSREELLDLYARATLAAVPSRYEGFGYGAAHALCAGIPVVAAETSSLPEVVGESGPLVGPDDLAGWVDALRDILEHRAAAEARAAAARHAAVERFSWTAAARAMSAVYRRALER
jgi:glycosyltransferase involved in cell wall biosynthesis